MLYLHEQVSNNLKDKSLPSTEISVKIGQRPSLWKTTLAGDDKSAVEWSVPKWVRILSAGTTLLLYFSCRVLMCKLHPWTPFWCRQRRKGLLFFASAPNGSKSKLQINYNGCTESENAVREQHKEINLPTKWLGECRTECIWVLFYFAFLPASLSHYFPLSRILRHLTH